MNNQDLDRLLEQYGKQFESIKVPDESKKHIKEGVLNRINQPQPFSLPATAWVAVAMLFALALGVFIYLKTGKVQETGVSRQASEQISIAQPAVPAPQVPEKVAPNLESAPETPVNSLDQTLDQMSEEELVLLVMELDDDELTLQLGDEFYAADLEAVEFAEWSA